MPGILPEFLLNPCDCGTCAKLRKAWHHLDKVVSIAHSEGDDSLKSGVKQSRCAIGEILRESHKKHRAELYSDDEDESEDSDSGDVQTDESSSEQGSGQIIENVNSRAHVSGKYLVCDHCHGHGLTCDENPICQQCLMSNTACVHRRCAKSPYSKEDCPDIQCHYYHEDFAPVKDEAFDTRDYFVLLGRLRGYLFDGQLPDLEWSDYGLAPRRQVKNKKDARKRQDEAYDAMKEWVGKRYGSSKHWCAGCGEGCARSDVD